MARLALPHLDGTTIHGWLATIGAVRVLAARWPELRVHWNWQSPSPVLTGGPATVDEASDAIYSDTVAAVPAGGVLPDCDPPYPPDGRDWYGQPLTAADTWPGESAAWQAALISPSGLPHPLLVPHAAQTVRRMAGKANAALAADPALLRQAIGGPRLGLTAAYPGGLWVMRWDRPHDEGGAQASPGRDWLALMGLPWMPARDAVPLDGDGDPRRGAPGWRWRLTAAGGHELVYEWRLWSQPLPASAIPAALDAPEMLPGKTVRCGALREPRTSPSDPPYLRDVPLAQVRSGRLDDARSPHVIGADGAASWLREHGHPDMTGAAVRQALRRARKARQDGDGRPRWMPEPDASPNGRTPGWRAATLASWSPVGRGSGGGRPRKV